MEVSNLRKMLQPSQPQHPGCQVCHQNNSDGEVDRILVLEKVPTRARPERRPECFINELILFDMELEPTFSNLAAVFHRLPKRVGGEVREYQIGNCLEIYDYSQ